MHAQSVPLDARTVLALQRAAGNRAVGRLVAGGNGHGESNGNGNGSSQYALQRKPANGAGEGALEQQAEKAESAVAKEPAGGKALLVEDDAQSLQPGQMRKSEFLGALKASVCSAADEELKGTIWSTMGCPYVERWFEVYQNKPSSSVERALLKYAPETQSATTAEQYIPLVTQRVRKGVAVWKKTGELTDVPPEFAQAGMPGATFEGLVSMGLRTIGGAIGGAVSKAAGAVGGAISSAARSVGSGIASIGRALFKAQPSGAHEPEDASAIQAQLQGGQTLDADVRGRMETVFSRDFSGVRVHTDGNASHLSRNLNARAFTIGRDVAFSAGEYQPGTLIGDALIAHELAHVVQQDNGKGHGAQAKGGQYDALEQDADRSAVGAVVSTWQGAPGSLGDVGRQAIPRLRSGLQLQRCAAKKPAVKTPTDKAKVQKAQDPAVQKLKNALISSFGFKEVIEEGEAKWSAHELNKMQTALSKIPAEQQSVLKGVTLKRVQASSCTGGDPAGCFIPKINPKTAVAENTIEIADPAFEADIDIEDPTGGKVTEYDLAGKVRTMLPSQRTILHEVGHAVESAEERAAKATRFKADLDTTSAQENLNQAVTNWNNTSPPAMSLIFSSSAPEKKYQRALIDVGRKLIAVIEPTNKLSQDPKGEELKRAVTATKTRVAAASKAVDARNTARKALKPSSSVIDPTTEQAQAANLKASENLVKALEKRRDAQLKLDTADKAQKAVTAKLTFSTGGKQVSLDVSRRLAELVALIHLKKIDIKKSGLSDYVKGKWPDEPGEVFADLYQMSVSEQEALEKFDPDIANFFKSPIGPKGKWDKQVATWIQGRQAP
jgi:hypothetical protein